MSNSKCGYLPQKWAKCYTRKKQAQDKKNVINSLGYDMLKTSLNKDVEFFVNLSGSPILEYPEDGEITLSFMPILSFVSNDTEYYSKYYSTNK